MGFVKDCRTKMGRFLDIPLNAFSDTVTAEIRDFCELMIQGCTCIREYSPSLIALDSSGGRVIVCGTDMVLTVFSPERIVIHGKIESVSKGEAIAHDVGSVK